MFHQRFRMEDDESLPICKKGNKVFILWSAHDAHENDWEGRLIGFHFEGCVYYLHFCRVLGHRFGLFVRLSMASLMVCMVAGHTVISIEDRALHQGLGLLCVDVARQPWLRRHVSEIRRCCCLRAS